MDTLLNARPSVNGKHDHKAKPKAKPKTSTRTAKQQLEAWAKRYVYAGVGMSSVLNGFAAVVDADAGALGSAAAAIVGGSIPLFVYGLSKVACWAHRAKLRRYAQVAGGITVALLVLSLYHCSHAISTIAGCPWVLSLLLAIGIDCGLVVSEAASVVVHDAE